MNHFYVQSVILWLYLSRSKLCEEFLKFIFSHGTTWRGVLQKKCCSLNISIFCVGTLLIFGFCSSPLSKTNQS